MTKWELFENEVSYELIKGHISQYSPELDDVLQFYTQSEIVTFTVNDFFSFPTIKNSPLYKALL